MDSAELTTLIKNVARGQVSSLEDIYRETKDAVYGYALSIVRNMPDAEDVLHDCYLKIYNGAAGYSDEGKPMAWIFTITRNLCYRRLEENRKKGASAEADLFGEMEAGGQLSAEELTVLSDCIFRLSESEQQVVLLHALSGYKHREIAEMLGKPLSTVLSSYSRALEKMRRM